MAPVQKKSASKFTIDVSAPVKDQIFDMVAYEKYMTDRIKVAGKTGQLGDSVKVVKSATVVSITVAPNVVFAKRYIKYLTKKFLKKQNLRDYLRVVATTKGAYEIRYFNIAAKEEEDEE